MQPCTRIGSIHFSDERFSDKRSCGQYIYIYSRPKPRVASRFTIVTLEAIGQLCKVSDVDWVSVRIQVLESIGLAVSAVMTKERKHAKDERDGVVNLVPDGELCEYIY